ncbi:MAG: YceI family protein [Bacteroidota bacterium]
MTLFRYLAAVAAAALVVVAFSTLRPAEAPASLLDVPAGSYTLDAVHSEVAFEVRHFGVSKVRGEFRDFATEIAFADGTPTSLSVSSTIQVASVDTDNERRDGHLRSDDFFNAEEFPTITFTSTRVEDADPDDDEFLLIGDLTIRDVTKEVTMEVEMLGPVIGMNEDTRIGFEAETEINRQDFNVKWGGALSGGELVVSDDVEIELNIEAILAE